MQQMQKDLTRTGSNGISITFQLSQFQEIACDIHSHLAIEVKINLKQRLGMFVKKKKIPNPVGLEPTNFVLEVQHATPLRHGGFLFCKKGNFCVICTSQRHLLNTVFFFQSFKFYSSKAWFEMFSRFIRSQR